MATDFGTPDYAKLAVGSLQSIKLPGLAPPEAHLAAAGVYAVTYALLDLAAAIRENSVGRTS